MIASRKRGCIPTKSFLYSVRRKTARMAFDLSRQNKSIMGRILTDYMMGYLKRKNHSEGAGAEGCLARYFERFDLVAWAVSSAL